MKCYQKGNKIVFTKNEDYKELEKTIQFLSKDFERLKSVCEDRTTEDFPVEIIKSIVKKTNQLATKGKDVELTLDYVNYMMQEKDALKYFENILEKVNEEEEIFEKKKNYLKKFASLLDS